MQIREDVILWKKQNQNFNFYSHHVSTNPVGETHFMQNSIHNCQTLSYSIFLKQNDQKVLKKFFKQTKGNIRNKWMGILKYTQDINSKNCKMIKFYK